MPEVTIPMPDGSRPAVARVRLACLISARNLGDAAIHSSVLLELSSRRFAENFLVWTKPAMAFLFDTIPRCDVVTSPVPLGTGQRFRPRDALATLRAAREVRRRSPDVTIDLVGDIRERWLAALAGSRHHLHIGWETGHPFEPLIRNPFGKGRPALTVPVSQPNVYDAFALFVDTLCPPVAGQHLVAGAVPPHAFTDGRAAHIGLHPFASQDNKLWPHSAWRELATTLIDRGVLLTVFCAASERERLRAIFGDSLDMMKQVAGSLSAFAQEVSRIDLMIGLDSFSIHMAQKQRVASIMVNAGNPATLWVPPGGAVVGHGGGCRYYPCYNVPKCEGKTQYVCVRSVHVGDVLAAVEQRLAAMSTGARHVSLAKHIP